MDIPNPSEVRDQQRRRILFLIPAVIFTSVGAAFAAVTFRFLRPQQEAATSAVQAGGWTPVAPLKDLSGAQPLARKVAVEQQAGWSVSRRERPVFVVTGQDTRIFSAICPHEGCEVEWVESPGEFVCPCHDSRFGADGSRLSGPAETALTQIPSRVVGGVLEIQTDGGALEATGATSRVVG